MEMVPELPSLLSRKDLLSSPLADKSHPLIKSVITQLAQMGETSLCIQEAGPSAPGSTSGPSSGSSDMAHVSSAGSTAELNAETAACQFLSGQMNTAVELFTEELAKHPVYCKIFINRNARKIILDSSYELLHPLERTYNPRLLDQEALSVLRPNQIQQLTDRRIIQSLPISQVAHISTVAVTHLQASKVRYLSNREQIQSLRYALVLR